MRKAFTSMILLMAVIAATAQLPVITIPDIEVGPNGQTAPEQQIDRQNILGHIVKLKEHKLQQWVSYDTIVNYSMNYLKFCPTHDTPNGQLPYYLITSVISQEGNFRANQNNQGGNLYFAMETFKRYYAYTGDKDALRVVKNLAEQIAKYHTPADFAWPNMPRTQDDTPDGVYEDEKGEPDKACMVAVAYIDYARFTGEKQYIALAEGIAKTVLSNLKEGNDKESPIPFRINMKTGAILDPYGSDMIFAVKMIDELLAVGTTLDRNDLQAKRKAILDWILKYPMENNLWSGYFEDVSKKFMNINQFNPMETARYLINHPECDPKYEAHIKKLIYFVKYRFGFIQHYGATGIAEQDACFAEMGSHTARYASVVAKWFGMTGDADAREEARASFALASYSAINKYSENCQAINYTGIGYLTPWFSDSYFDYLTHILEGMGDIPEMVQEDTDHVFYTSSMITDINYGVKGIKYTAYDKNGEERIKLTYTPAVYANGKPLPQSQWSFGEFRGVKNVLTIKRQGVQNIEIRKK